MRRSLWNRAYAAAFGLWFTVVMAGLALHVCPEHGGVTIHVARVAAPHHGGDCPPSTTDRRYHDDADHGSSLPADHGQGTSPGHHHGKHCTCPGTCCATGAVTLASGRLIAIPVVPVAVAAVAPLTTTDVSARTAPDVVLPPPLGPPALRA